MNTPKPKVPTVFVPDHIDCEQWGQGGSFIVDPKTGKRTRVPDEAEGEITGDGSGVALAPINTANPTEERTAAAKKGGK